MGAHSVTPPLGVTWFVQAEPVMPRVDVSRWLVIDCRAMTRGCKRQIVRLVKRLPSGTVDEVLEISAPDDTGPGRAVWSQRVRGTTRVEPVRDEIVRTQALFTVRVRNAHLSGMREEPRP
jgi:hypothetical protein